MAKLNVVVSAVEVTVEGGAKYRKVDRKAAAGDIVKALDDFTDIKSGDFFAVYSRGDGRRPAFDDRNWDPRGLLAGGGSRYFEVYEKVAETKRRLTVGDYAKVVRNVADHNYDIGNVVKVIKDDRDGTPYMGENADGTVGNWMKEADVEPATEAEFLAQKKPVVKREFIVGDKVRSRPSGNLLRTLKERIPGNDGRYGKAWRTVEGAGWLGEDQFELVEAATPKTEDDVIVHEGRSYRKVARKANVGELVEVFGHPVTEQNTVHTIRNVDSDGHIYYKAGGRSPGGYYVLEPIETTPQYTEVKRNAIAGDRIRIVDIRNHSVYGMYKNGDEFVVKQSVYGDDVYVDAVKCAGNASGLIFRKEYVVLEPVTPATPQYREVKRKAKVGERIRIVEPYITGGNYSKGDELTATGRSGAGVYITLTSGSDFFIADDEYVVLEPVTATVPEPQPARLKVGEYAKVVDDSTGMEAFRTEGDIVIITEDDGSSTPFNTKHLDGKYAGWAWEKSLVRATDEEVAAAREASKRALDPRSKFAVGDKVRLVAGGSSHPLNGFPNDKVYEVSDPFTALHSGKRVGIKNEVGNAGFALPDQLVKVTAEEIAEGERKATEEAKWSAIGRKVDELRNGDIVRFTESTGAGDYGTGKVAEIRNVEGTRFNFGVGGINYLGNASWCELVTPVEQRFDAKATA